MDFNKIKMERILLKIQIENDEWKLQETLQLNINNI